MIVVNRESIVLRDFARGFKLAKHVVQLKKDHSTEVAKRDSPPSPANGSTSTLG